MSQQHTFPPFPDDIPTHPLLIVDFEKIKIRDLDEINRLWEAATKLGFWYLKNHGCSKEADNMFSMGAEAMSLPLSEKLKYEQGDNGVSTGYKAAGANAVDATGQPDITEFFNVSKDDALQWRGGNQKYPAIIENHISSTVFPFIRKCVDVNAVMLDIFNDKLNLPPGTLATLHPDKEPSKSEARITHTPPILDTNRVALGSHTDFGSLSILFNRLGGLQVLPPSSDTWQYVKPLPGHAICNVGDALSLLSGGTLRSNMHRVLPPPGAQARSERWSLAYFTRPQNDVFLKPLIEDSRINIPANLAMGDGGYQTAAEWFVRRAKNQRLRNRKGPETWEASRGTEAKPLM